MAKKTFKNKVKYCRSYSGADIDSNHNLVTMKHNLKFKKMVPKRNNDRWHTNKLKGEKANDLNNLQII